jgi:hypothetical protein
VAEIPLRRWLQKQPHPSFVNADMSDGTEKRIRISASRSRFRDAEEALKGAVACEAVDEDGVTVLRSWESGEKPATDGKAAKQGPSELVALANVLAQVADQAVQRYSQIMQQSFEQNAKLLGLLSGRLSAIEKLYHSSLIAQAEALAAEQEAVQQQAEEQNDPNLPLVAQVLTQALGGGMNGAQKEKE